MKLPQIQYRATPTAQAQGPGVAVAEYSQKQNLLNQAQKAAEDITNSYREFNVTKADAAYADEMADFRTEAAKMDVLSPGEVAALDLDIETEGRDKILKAEWYPKLLEKRMEEYRGKHAASIRSPVDRQKWSSAVAKNDAKILEREIERATAETLAYKDQELVQTYNEAKGKGDLATMEMVVNDPTFLRDSDSMRQRNSLEADFDREVTRLETEAFETGVNRVIDTGSDAELAKQLSDLIDPEKRDDYPGSERSKRILTSRIKSEQDRRLRNSALNESQNEDVARDEMNKIKAGISGGFPVTDQMMDTARDKVAGTKYAREFELYENTLNYSVGSVEQRQQDKADLYSGGIDNAEEFALYREADAQITKGYAEQGLLYGQKQGLIKLEPLTDAASLEKRREQAAFLTEHSGVKVSPYTQGDIDDWSQRLAVMGVQEKMAAAAAFAETPEVWSQFMKSGSSSFAVAGQSADQNVAHAIFKGQEAYENETVVKINDKEALLVAREVYGDVYDDANLAAHIEAANMYYYSQAPTGDDGEFDSSLYETALSAVSGGVGELNGYKTAAPKGSTVSDLQDFVDDVTPEQVFEFGGVMDTEDAAAAQMLQQAQWKSIDNDQYMPLWGGQILMTAPAPGKPSVPMVITVTSDDIIQAKSKITGDAAEGRLATMEALETAFVDPARAVAGPVVDALSRYAVEPVAETLELFGARSAIYERFNTGRLSLRGISKSDIELVLPELKGKQRQAALKALGR